MSGSSHGGTPLWRLLAPGGISLLVSEDGTVPPAISVIPCADPAVALSGPLVRTVRAMIEHAVTRGAIALTPSGKLRRADLRPFYTVADWQDWPRDVIEAICKAPNESDVVPLQVARVTALKAGLLRRSGKVLVATKAGASLLREDKAGHLLARLVETSFWKVPQEQFDGVRVAPWPQDHVGVVLWCLGLAGTSWRDTEELFPLCVIPYRGMAEERMGDPHHAFYLRIVRPAVWLGLLAFESHGKPGDWRRDVQRMVRKSPLFDAVLRFGVAWARPAGVVH